MPGPDQQPKGLLTMYVKGDGSVEIHLGKVFDEINPSNGETQWMHRIRDDLEKAAKLFLMLKGKGNK
jgi:hypothetical protein